MDIDTVYLGDSLDVIKTFPDESIDCVVTSPPYYGLRDYGVDGQIGLEESPEDYIGKLVELFREIRRCLKKDGTIWVNLGDSYNGYKGNAVSSNADSKYVGGDMGGAHPSRESGFGLEAKSMKPKDLMGIPWMFAFALRNDGWYLRQDIIWAKPNPMPESVTDRCTKSHEYIFLLSKSEKYYFDQDSILEPCSSANNFKIKERTNEQGYSKAGGHRDNSGGFGYKEKDGRYARNKRDVWTVNVKPNKEAHFATYPQDLISPCILAGCPEGGIVLDPFMGSGTTGIVARKLGRHFVGVELNPEYHKMAVRRIDDEGANLFM